MHCGYTTSHPTATQWEKISGDVLNLADALHSAAIHLLRQLRLEAARGYLARRSYRRFPYWCSAEHVA